MSNGRVDAENCSRDRGRVVSHALNESASRLEGRITNSVHNKNVTARLLRGVSYGLAWAARSLRADRDQRAASGVRINPARHGLIGEIARRCSFCSAIGRDYDLIITTGHLAFGRIRAGRANKAEL